MFVSDKVTPAIIRTATDLGRFTISDIDDAANPKYYGYIDKEGSWYIMEENTTNKSFRYAVGDTDYPTNWTARAGLTYDYYNNVF